MRKGTGLLVVLLLVTFLAGCAPAVTPPPPVVVKETVQIPVPIRETVIVKETVGISEIDSDQTADLVVQKGCHAIIVGNAG